MLNDFAAAQLENCYRWFPEWSDEPAERQIVHYTLGIAGESGEVVELIKKWQGGRVGYEMTDSFRARLAEEICDVLMYCGDLAGYLKLDLDEAMAAKIVDNNFRFR